LPRRGKGLPLLAMTVMVFTQSRAGAVKGKEGYGRGRPLPYEKNGCHFAQNDGGCGMVMQKKPIRKYRENENSYLQFGHFVLICIW